MKNIISPANKYIKDLVSLKKSAKRKEAAVFLIDGKREIEEAIAANTEIEQIFI